MALPKWTDERTEALTSFVGDESPVSQETVAEAAEQMETSTRSIASKLRKMGFEVEAANARATKSFTEEQEGTLKTFLVDNSGQFTYAQLAEHFEGGTFSAKQLQGKILSMELTEHVAPTPKAESTRTYTDAEEEQFVSLVADGSYLEDIAEAMGRPVNSIRGKALSLLRSGRIDGIPAQKHVKGDARVDPLSELSDLASMTVEAIAEAINKTPRGVKTMLTRRGLVAADYDGAAKAAKTAAAE